MHTVFALEITVCVIAFNLHCNGFNAGFFAVLQVADRNFIAMSFGISHIHSHKHGSPVLTLSSTRTGIDFEHTRHLIFLAAKHVLHLKCLYLLNGFGISVINLFFLHHTFLMEINGKGKFVNICANFLITIDPTLKFLYCFHLLLGFLGIFPEIGSLRMELRLLEFYLLFVNIKIASEFCGAVLYLFQLFRGYHTFYTSCCRKLFLFLRKIFVPQRLFLFSEWV